MNPTEPPDDGQGEAKPAHTPVSLKYAAASQVTATDTAADMALVGNTLRDPVALEAKAKDPLHLREALSALYAVVGSDYRYKPKDRAAYAAFLRMRRESSHLGVWQAQQAYFSWLHRNDPLAALILDPIVSVHPDGVFLEVFSKDESSYGHLLIDKSVLEFAAKPTCGTTNIDFSQALYDGIQQMRNYRETKLHITPLTPNPTPGVPGEESKAALPSPGTPGVGLGVRAGSSVGLKTPGATDVLEKQIRVPDSWLRGFLQVQSAATLPMDSFRLTPMDLYNLLRYLRLNGDKKGKRRGLRIELVPGEMPRLVLEPWEKVLHTGAAKFTGKAARVVRVWGRRRLLLVRRLLPFIESVDVHLLGSGLPSFWIFRGHGITLTIGMSGFTASNWSQAVNFDLMLPRQTQSSEPLESVIRYLADDVWFASSRDIGKAAGIKGPALLETLQMGCQQGKLMYDIGRGVFRLRPIVETPLDLLRLQYRNQREKIAHDLLVRREAVRIVSENRIAGTGLELVGQVSVTEDRRDYRPQMLLGDEGQVSKAECTCSLFRKQGVKSGPCVHLIALRLAYAEQERRRARGVDPRQVITVETRTYTKRLGEIEEVFQVTLERKHLKMRWGKASEPMRQQTLRYNSVDDARTAYFARISALDERGYVSATGD